MKKMLVLLLVLCLCLPCFAACDDEKGTEGLEFYPLSDGTYGVMVGMATYCEEIIIPSKHNGKKVTQILPNAFSLAVNLKTITIPNSVKSIGRDAFSYCINLENVHIKDLTKWCEISFENDFSNPLSYANNLYVKGTLVTELVIPDGATSISSYAFSGCTSLTSIEIPDSVTSIGERAFFGCRNLTSVTIGDGVTNIGYHAFSDCTKLMNVTLPAMAIEFIPKNNLQTVVITSGESIGSSAFEDCTSLTSIEISDSVTSIDIYAFSGCNNLTSVTIGDGVTSIGSYAFYKCTSLEIIMYNGTSAQWKAIDKGFGWNHDIGELIIRCRRGNAQE